MTPWHRVADGVGDPATGVHDEGPAIDASDVVTRRRSWAATRSCRTAPYALSTAPTCGSTTESQAASSRSRYVLCAATGKPRCRRRWSELVLPGRGESRPASLV